MEKIDMLVIGSGPAGRRAAIQSAKLGKSVLVVDRGSRLGGVSVHTGTIPSKTLRETVLNLSGFRERGFYGAGYRVKAEISAGDLLQRLHKTLDHEVEVLQHQFMRNGVRSAFATARFLDAHTAELTTETGEVSKVEFENALIAVGTRPHRPDTIPFDRTRVFDSDEILELKTLPRSLTVIGGGVIGTEYATIFSALDVPVTLIESRETILDFVDREIVDEFIHQMRDRGMTIRLGAKVDGVTTDATGVTTVLSDGRKVRSETLLFAAGRSGNVGSLNLDSVGMSVDSRGRLNVDPSTFQTEVPNIYAAGDVIGFPSLASPRPRWSRAASRPATPSGSSCRRRPRPFPMASTRCPKSRLWASRRSRRRPRASPTNAAWRGFARRRAATSWGSTPAF
ncbi:Soluble pyridine nucleotide transhydrogenase [Roseisalinus antarcticus]|uniref:Soluble pyridine nucleotide transhydrogenase n=1 Tax=Roseisalinus antarcticus TaxID=254357 RepID=A0A1Y5S2X6_9RHOB|nr:Soluble pyridine nucleotide transhydrogenase [Roseisalinus antarcticus]